MKCLNQLVILAAAVLARPQDWGTPMEPDHFNYKLVGNGDPHQAYMYKQVTTGTECNGDSKGETCSTAHSKTETYTIGWSGGISGAGWISGGFDVSKSVSTGEVNSCTGEASDTVCVWWRTAHTAYTVQEFKNGKENGDPYIIWSPNSNGVGSNYVCGRNDECDHLGAEWWGSKGPAGGPQKYPEDGPAWL